MNQPNIEELKYPIGKFSKPATYTKSLINLWINEIAALPLLMEEATSGLNDEQLNTPYRPDGWTIRQVVHHVADSHMNSYIRFKLALTEENPTIKPYEEGDWANLTDGKSSPIHVSLKLLEALHERWVIVLKNISEEELEKTFFHPGSQKQITLKENLGVYAWHGKHHLAHITKLKERMGWK